MNYTAVGVLLLASFLTAAYKLQFALLYPSSYPEGSRTHVQTPDEYDMQFEDVKLLTPDGENIHLYVIPSVLKIDHVKTVLFLGPNAGNMGNSLPLARLVHSWGYNVVLVSYRGYGKSTGKPSEKGLKIDADTTLKYIEEHPKLQGKKLILYGRSLGGAVAIYGAMAARRGLVNGLILENTFTSIPKIAPNVVPYTSFLTLLCTERWESDKLIDKIDPELPVLFLAGAMDELIPPKMFRELYDKCSSKNKSYKSFPQGTHNDTCVQKGYWEEIGEFLLKV